MCPTIISASCIHLIITSMGHLVCCYLSALIDCLPKFRRVGCVCLFCLTNGHHLSTHLRAKLRAGSRGATAIENRSTCLDERNIHQRLINKKNSSMPQCHSRRTQVEKMQMKAITTIITSALIRFRFSDRKKEVRKMALNLSQILAVFWNLPITALSNRS